MGIANRILNKHDFILLLSQAMELQLWSKSDKTGKLNFSKENISDIKSNKKTEKDFSLNKNYKYNSNNQRYTNENKV